MNYEELNREQLIAELFWLKAKLRAYLSHPSVDGHVLRQAERKELAELAKE